MTETDELSTQVQKLKELLTQQPIKLRVQKDGSGKLTARLLIGTTEIIPTTETVPLLRQALVQLLEGRGVLGEFTYRDRKETVTFVYREKELTEMGITEKRGFMYILDTKRHIIGMTHYAIKGTLADDLRKTYVGDAINPSVVALTNPTKTQYERLGLMRICFSLLAEWLLAHGRTLVQGTINQQNVGSVKSRVEAPALLENGYYSQSLQIEDPINIELLTDLTRIVDQPLAYQPPNFFS